MYNLNLKIHLNKFLIKINKASETYYILDKKTMYMKHGYIFFKLNDLKIIKEDKYNSLR